MEDQSVYITANNVIVNNVVNSFNNNTNCQFDNDVSFSQGESGTTSVKRRAKVSNEEFCSVWTRYHLVGLSKICEVLNVTRNWAWFRYLFLTNEYNGVNLPECAGSVPDPVDAETLNAIISEITPES
jgi:hypothetical protein